MKLQDVLCDQQKSNSGAEKKWSWKTRLSWVLKNPQGSLDFLWEAWSGYVTGTVLEAFYHMFVPLGSFISWPKTWKGMQFVSG